MVSAYQYVHGSFDYNKTPLAPLGCAVQLFESNSRRGTWAEHSTDGWYIETLMEHYRCHRIYVKKTRGERISDTVFFIHKYITQPKVTPADTIVKALGDLMHALKGRRNVKGTSEIEALERIDKLLNNIPKQLEQAGTTEETNHIQRSNSTTEGKQNPNAETTNTRTNHQATVHRGGNHRQANPLTPRVHEETRTVLMDTMSQKTTPTQRVIKNPEMYP